MTKKKIIGLLFAFSAACIYPCWANDSVGTPPLISKPESADNVSINQPQPSATDAASANSPPAGKTSQATKASLPKKVFSVATAFIVGTPVCVVRRTKYEEWYGVNGLIGNSNNKCKKVLARIIWFPCAVICGTGEAPFDALANGLMYPAFSKDQLSQGKLIQNN